MEIICGSLRAAEILYSDQMDANLIRQINELGKIPQNTHRNPPPQLPQAVLLAHIARPRTNDDYLMRALFQLKASTELLVWVSWFWFRVTKIKQKQLNHFMN